MRYGQIVICERGRGQLACEGPYYLRLSHRLAESGYRDTRIAEKGWERVAVLGCLPNSDALYNLMLVRSIHRVGSKIPGRSLGTLYRQYFHRTWTIGPKPDSRR